MKTTRTLKVVTALLSLPAPYPQRSTCLAQGAAFNYQVRLSDGANLKPNGVSPNFIGGHPDNLASNGLWGAAISGGGKDNTASGNYATVPGGRNNAATTDAFAAGKHAQANHAGSFVWSSRPSPAPSVSGDRFHVHAAEGFSVDDAGQRPDGGRNQWVVLGGFSDFPGQTISTWTGARLTDGGVSTDNSDRNGKENFTPVDPRDILERVAALPVQQWNHEIEGPDVSRIGPVAQDFYAAFGTGTDDKHLAALDSAGVALPAIQGLNRKLERELRQKEAILQSRQQQIAGLLRRLGALESKLINSAAK